MANIPFILGLDSPAYFGHDMFPNRVYRQQHPRHHTPLDLHTLGMIARMGLHGGHGGLSDNKNGENVKSDKNGLEVFLDVGLYQPHELSVKVINDCIVVEGKYEEREDDHGFMSKHFVRRYNIPKHCKVEDVESTLSPDGVLTVRAPMPAPDDKSNERVVEIRPTGPSDLFVKGDKKGCVDQKTDEEAKK